MRIDFATLACASVLAATAAHADILKGVVQDSAGVAVVDADFDVFAPDGTLLAPDDNTDTDGSYTITLPAGHYDVVCTPVIASGLAAHVIHDVSVSGITRLNWVLGRSARVIGRVVRADGAAVANANLNFDRFDDGARQPLSGDRTSIFGTFAAYVEPGDYRITVLPPTGVDLAAAFVPLVRVPTTDTLRFVLHPAVHLSGVVRDAAGQGVADARLSFRRSLDDERVPAWGNHADPAGAFRAGVVADSYRVLVQPPRGRRLAAVRIPVDLRRDRTLDVTLPAGIVIAGTILDRARAPVPNASWSAVDEVTEATVPTPDDESDWTGRFELALPRGVYRLTLKPPLASGLDTLVFRGVRVERDTVLDVLYRDPQIPVAGSVELVPLGTPTHRRATVRMVLARAGRVRVDLFDVTGRHTRRLVDDFLPAGVHDLHWDGERPNGARAHTGLYFVRAEQDEERALARFILLP